MTDEELRALLDAASNEYGTAFIPGVGIKYYEGSVENVTYVRAGDRNYGLIQRNWGDDFSIAEHIAVNGRLNINSWRAKHEREQREAADWLCILQGTVDD